MSYYSLDKNCVEFFCKTDPHFEIACEILHEEIGNFIIIDMHKTNSKITGDLNWFITTNNIFSKSLITAWMYIESKLKYGTVKIRKKEAEND